METLVILLQLIHRLLNINQVFLKNQDVKGVLRNVKIAGPLKYLSIFWRSLEIPLINCKMHLDLNWTNNCVMSNIDGNTKVKKTNTKFCVKVVTLSTKHNAKLTKQLNKGFKKPVYWND